MKKCLVSLALFLASLTGLAQKATVTATISTYANGSARAFFINQGGGSPTINQASATINGSGVFSLNAWNNSYSVYAPSQTQVIICGPFPYASTCYSVLVNITSSSQDISSALSGAPVPGGSGGSPTGAAGGSLSGTYPNPGLAALTALQATALFAGVTGCTTTAQPFVPADGQCEAISGTGTVTSFSMGNLAPLFTTTVATPTSTPAVTLALSNAAQNSVFAGPASGGAGAPSYQTAPTISAANMTSFPTLNQNTTGKSAGFTGCTNSAAGDICYWSSSAWTVLTGNATGTRFLSESASGVPAWDTNLDDGVVNASGLTYGGSAGYFGKSFNSTDTVNNGSAKFGNGSGGDSTCPAAASGLSYLCQKSSVLNASVNGGAYSPVITQATENVGTVTAVSVATANGFSGSSSGGATPALTIIAGAITPSSMIATGIADGQAAMTVTTGSSATLGGTYSSGYTVNEEGTAGTAVTYTLPTAVAGKQYCVANGYNGSAANTGTLEILTSASGQFIIYTDGTLSATGGYVISAGAAGDKACVVGVDSTHWLLYTQSGTWAKH